MTYPPTVREMIINFDDKGQIIAAVVDERIGTILLTSPEAVNGFREMFINLTGPHVLGKENLDRSPSR